MALQFSQSSWKRQHEAGEHGLVYERPLGLLETVFYWDGIFERTADLLRCSEINVVAGQLDQVAGLSNVARSWNAVKKQYPILAARVEERDEFSLFFVVHEERLKTCHPDEITFLEVSSWEDVLQLADDILVKEHQMLSNDLLARVFILRQKGSADKFYVMSLLAHNITDGLSNITLLKTLLKELCGATSPDAGNLEDRLALSVASEDLYPNRSLALARRRWRRAIVSVIGIRRRETAFKGGHTIPRKITDRTQLTPARSNFISISLPSDLSSQIIANCRRKGVTFGNAYPIIGQVAIARLLLKRRLRGEIDDAEWEFRKREPMLSVGPLNLRPYLDPEWLKAGGFGHISVCIGFYFYSIGFLPLGEASGLRPGEEEPPVGSLLSKARFFLRAQSVKKQANSFLKHPLFLDIGESLLLGPRIVRVRETGLLWRKDSSAVVNHLSEDPLSPIEEAAKGVVFSNGGSSMGNIDLLLPTEYSSDPESTTEIKLQLGSDVLRLRCRPAEQYLGAETKQGKMHLHVFFDSNVYDEELMKEWLNEVKLALQFYLGGENADTTE